MDNLSKITDPIEKVLLMMAKHQLAVVADKKLDLALMIVKIQRHLIKTQDTNKHFNEQWKFFHNAHEDLMGGVERVYGI
tara:strand:- start:1001 stop:1237 length:237 start_codon:yes stop_codon:yes gene_type:complete